jgi:hypothetical protein
VFFNDFTKGFEMPRMELTLESLKELDHGKIASEFHVHLRRAIEDCLSRPAEGKARTVRMELTVVPSDVADADCEQVDIRATITSTVPKARSKNYRMTALANGRVTFHDELPDNPDGRTIVDEAEERARERNQQEGSDS